MVKMTGRLLGSTALVTVGFVLGLAAAVGAYLAANRTTVVFTTTETIAADGIVIPAGIELVHEAAMSEGFDTLRLYVNVDPATLEHKFRRRVDPRAFLVIPYWVEE